MAATPFWQTQTFSIHLAVFTLIWLPIWNRWQRKPYMSDRWSEFYCECECCFSFFRTRAVICNFLQIPVTIRCHEYPSINCTMRSRVVSPVWRHFPLLFFCFDWAANCCYLILNLRIVGHTRQKNLHGCQVAPPRLTYGFDPAFHTELWSLKWS